MPESFNAHVLLAKYPDPRCVKTRLVNGARETGYAGLKHLRHAVNSPWSEDDAHSLAADLYRAFLIDRFRAHQNRAYALYLGTTQPERKEAFRNITGPDVRYYNVNGTNLGEMMFRIFQGLLPSHPCVIISGSDFPYLPERIVDRAFRALETTDVVLVPAYDGAYNLIGMRRLHNIFTIPKWSSGSELSETVKLLRSRHIPHRVLDDARLLDIDTLDDLRMLIHTLRETQAPVTYAKLKALQKQLRIASQA